MKRLCFCIFPLMIFLFSACLNKWKVGASFSEEIAGLISYSYACNLRALDENSQLGVDKEIFLTWMAPKHNDPPGIMNILVSDSKFLNSPSAIIVVVDKERMQIDQIRNKNGSALEHSLTSATVPIADAIKMIYAHIGEFILQEGVKAINRFQKSKSENSFISFKFREKNYTTDSQNFVPAVKNYGPFPRLVKTLTGEIACEFRGIAQDKK